MPNVSAKLKGHNARILAKELDNTRPNKDCNCRQAASCPLGGKCLTSGIVYAADITRTDNGQTFRYTGLTENTFKQRYYQHTSTFRYPKHRHSTELANKVWELKESDTPYSIQWSIIERANPYSNVSKSCNLCVTEKLHISNNAGHHASLNKRSELISKCRHQNKFTLCNLSSIT